MKIFLYFVRTYPWHTFIMVLCLVLAGFAGGLGFSAVPVLLGIATGETDPADRTPLEEAVLAALAAVHLEPTIGVLLAIIATAFGVKAVLVLLSKARVGYTVAHTATDLRIDLLRSLMSARWTYYTRQPVGAISNAMATEADRASQAYFFLAQMCAHLAEALIYIGIAFTMSWRATLVAMLGGAFSLLLLNALVRMAMRAGRRQTALLKSLLGRLNDGLQAVKMLKSMARESLIGPLLEDDTRRLNRQLKRRVFSKEALMAMQEPILVLFVCSYVYVAIVMWEMPINSLLVLVFLLVQVIRSLNKVQRKYQFMVTEGSALWSIRGMIDDAREHEEPTSGTAAPSLDRGISLEGVSIDYDGQRVLDDLSLTAPAGQVTAIVGDSGSGKTTLVDLITGLVRPDRGQVCIDGVPLADLDLVRWRQMIGYVPQEMLVLHDSVRVNVTLGDPDIGASEVETALRDAGAWGFVSNLPEGVESSMGEHGALFSGGQRQRIAIARALVHRPKLLLLDEATTALDPESAAAVWETVAQLRGKATVIAISHQPALTGFADRVYRIENGRPVEESPGADRRDGRRVVA